MTFNIVAFLYVIFELRQYMLPKWPMFSASSVHFKVSLSVSRLIHNLHVRLENDSAAQCIIYSGLCGLHNRSELDVCVMFRIYPITSIPPKQLIRASLAIRWRISSLGRRRIERGLYRAELS